MEPEYTRQWTTRFPPLSVCSTVDVPLQLLENQRPPDFFQTVMPIVSLFPGSPLSSMVTCSVAFPSTGHVLNGFVMSWILALPLNMALPVDGLTESEVMALPFTW